ncbi:MAG: hypothetical protein QOH51_1583 [Acidobacteriota bacterium]|jgi:hypothetical protein|nr:hypothetical protein [Acidobacteriota bacterium]
MTKKVLSAIALFIMALTTTAILTGASVSAQQLASTRTPAGVGAATGVRSARLLKRMSMSVGETAEGSRVRITSDAPLEGYETYTEGGRFFVLIPDADATLLAPGRVDGRGFKRVETGQRGDDALIAFTLEPDVAPRVRASFNRLEILFAAQQPTSSGSNANAAGTPTPTPPPDSSTTTPPPSSNPSTGAGTTSGSGGASPSNASGAAKAASVVPGTSAAKLAALLTPEKVSPTGLTRFDKAPVIDGKLDEEVWKNAAVFKDFIQTRPGDLTPPSQPTEVRLGYDSKFLYIGFHAFDEAGKVRATIAKRDNIFDDDWVGVWLDTFNDGRRAYELIFNPLGVQADAVFTEGVNEDFSIDIVMESKGVVTQDGYTVEVAIPFKSLRYEAGKDKKWGLHLIRTIKHYNNEQSSWMPISRDNSSLLGQEGHVTGLEGISTERTVEIIPSLTVSEQGRRVPIITPGQRAAAGGRVPADPGRFLNKPVGFDPGITAKFGISPTMTLDFTYNPDFAQVEADATVVTANQRFPIFFEEKRPFFLEGKEIFETLISAVHTRTIVDPDYAVKFTGKRGKDTFGVMLASDNAPGNLSDEQRDFVRDLRNPEPDRNELLKVLDKNATIGVLRLKHDIGKEGHIGFLATSYNFIDHYNQVAGFDTRYRLNKTTVFTAQALGSVTHNPFFYPDEATVADRKEQGLAYAYDLNTDGRNWGYEYSGVGRSRFFRADVGFNRRFNTNSQDLFVRYKSNDKPKSQIINWRFFNNTTGNFDWAGHTQFFQNESQLQLQLQKQSYLGFGVEEGYERVFESEFGPTRNALSRVAINTFGPVLASRVPACDPTGSLPPVIEDDPTTLDVDETRFLSPCTFFGGDPERSAFNRDIYIFAGTTPSKKYSATIFSLYRWGQLDFDFGTGNPDFPRVSPIALINPGAPLDPGPGNEWRLESSFAYQPTDALRLSLDYNKDRLTRHDTGRLAFDDNIFSLRGTYQFTRFWFARARIDYTTLGANARGQFLLGWTPNPGTTFYVGYNDDMNRNGVNPFSGQLEPGFRRNGRLFFIKMSYLIRRSFGN